SAGPQELVYTITTKGRLADPKEFENIIVRANPDGSNLRLKDVARVELASKDYEFVGRMNGREATLAGVFLLPGANALEVADNVVHAPDELVVLRGELDARHVLQAQVRAVGIGAQDDVLELLRVGEPALGGDGVDELLRARARRLSDLAGGELRVLLVQRADQIGGREAQLREAIGPHPDAHCVVLGAEDLHIRR